MSVTQSQIAALNAAIATGEQAVRTRNGTVEYRSIGELIKARDDLVTQMAAETAAAAGQPKRRLFNLFHAGRGY